MHCARRLAASIVVTAAAVPACRGRRPDAGTLGGERTRASISVTDTGCEYHAATSCPRGAACNPPAPVAIDCPREVTDAPADSTRDDYRPLDRAGWLRVKEHVSASELGCFFDSDRYCPPLHMDAPCDPGKSEKLDCTLVTPDGGVRAPSSHSYEIPGFVAHRAGDRCARYAKFMCDARVCKPPDPEWVECSER